MHFNNLEYIQINEINSLPFLKIITNNLDEYLEEYSKNLYFNGLHWIFVKIVISNKKKFFLYKLRDIGDNQFDNEFKIFNYFYYDKTGEKKIFKFSDDKVIIENTNVVKKTVINSVNFKLTINFKWKLKKNNINNFNFVVDSFTDIKTQLHFNDDNLSFYNINNSVQYLIQNNEIIKRNQVNVSYIHDYLLENKETLQIDHIPDETIVKTINKNITFPFFEFKFFQINTFYFKNDFIFKDNKYYIVLEDFYLSDIFQDVNNCIQQISDLFNLNTFLNSNSSLFQNFQNYFNFYLEDLFAEKIELELFANNFDSFKFDSIYLYNGKEYRVVKMIFKKQFIILTLIKLIGKKVNIKESSNDAVANNNKLFFHSLNNNQLNLHFVKVLNNHKKFYGEFL